MPSKTATARESAFVRRAMLLALAASVLLAACVREAAVPRVEPGQSRAGVEAILGPPDNVSDFMLPDEPFYGPQEGLASVVDPGTVTEQWRYETSESVVYIWFAGTGAEAPRESWTVVDMATYPAGVVFEPSATAD